MILNTAVEGTIPGALSIVQLLQDKLEKAGALVEVVNEGSDDKSTVKSINKLFGDVLLSVKVSSNDSATIYHYPKSQKNEKMAQKLAISGMSLNVEGSKSRLITFANTYSFVVELPKAFAQEKVVEGLYQFLIDYFAGIE